MASKYQNVSKRWQESDLQTALNLFGMLESMLWK